MLERRRYRKRWFWNLKDQLMWVRACAAFRRDRWVERSYRGE